MKARFETVDGKVTLKVYYDPALCNSDEAIAAGLASFGLKQGQAAILAFPIHHPGGTGRPETRHTCFLQGNTGELIDTIKRGNGQSANSRIFYVPNARVRARL